MRRFLYWFLSLLLVAIFTGCGNDNGNTEVSGVELANMDNTIKPQDDIYDYVNGDWLKKTVIPSDKSSYSAFTEVYEKTQKDLNDIIDEISKKPSDQMSDDEKKIYDLYRSFMDTDTIEKLGISPLQNYIDEISDANSYEELVPIMAKLSVISVTVPVDYYVDVDANNSKEYILYFYQSGLGMPNRDYYIGDDSTFGQYRTAYKKYIADILSLSGFDKDANQTAQDIYNLEYNLSTIQWSSVENRDTLKTYNKMSPEDFAKLTGDFNMSVFLQDSDFGDIKNLVVYQPSYFQDFGKMYKKIPLNTWKEYLIYHLVSDYAPYLSSDFDSVDFEFYSKTLAGIDEEESRDKRGIELVNDILGMMFGKLYVERYFPPIAKSRMETLVQNIIKSYDKSIDEITWMSDTTKEAAREKLHKIVAKIGYPDKWEDYSSLEMRADDLVGNLIRHDKYYHQKNVEKLKKPIDRTEWGMNPQTVNAYYDPTKNEVVFPAAILQPPFFQLDADMAINYGAIGSVIGHEISHAFDDQGSKYDGDGNLHDWWTKEDAQKFEELGEKLAKQYSQYEPLPGHHIDGNLTLGENMADLSGVDIGYKAYKLSLDGNKSIVLDGFTGEQRFFIGWAQIWRNKMREEELLRRLTVDVHSPAKYRVIGVFSNLDSFYDAFDVKEGDKMYKDPADRVVIW